MTEPSSIAHLATRLIDYADHIDAFGKTQEGNDVRLAASVLVQFEAMVTQAFAEIRTQLDAIRVR